MATLQDFQNKLGVSKGRVRIIAKRLYQTQTFELQDCAAAVQYLLDSQLEKCAAKVHLSVEIEFRIGEDFDSVIYSFNKIETHHQLLDKLKTLPESILPKKDMDSAQKVHDDYVAYTKLCDRI